MRRLIVAVRADWDSEAQVFVATSDDVPGLVAEAATLDALEEKLATLIPELVELNGMTHERTASGKAGAGQVSTSGS